MAIRQSIKALYACQIRKVRVRQQIASPGGGLAIARRLRRYSRDALFPFPLQRLRSAQSCRSALRRTSASRWTQAETRPSNAAPYRLRRPPVLRALKPGGRLHTQAMNRASRGWARRDSGVV
jgi:hypothetical protein